jgi:hypothetical protein
VNKISVFTWLAFANRAVTKSLFGKRKSEATKIKQYGQRTFFTWTEQHCYVMCIQWKAQKWGDKNRTICAKDIFHLDRTALLCNVHPNRVPDKEAKDAMEERHTKANRPCYCTVMQIVTKFFGLWLWASLKIHTIWKVWSTTHASTKYIKWMVN